MHAILLVNIKTKFILFIYIKAFFKKIVNYLRYGLTCMEDVKVQFS